MRRSGSFFIWLVVVALGVWATTASRAAETLPPRPDQYFNDSAGVVARSVAQTLDRELEDFERETSNQLVVAVYPSLPSKSSVEDFTVRTAQTWGVGQKGRNNGAVLFVFVAEHSVRIEVGYGLEPVLTDATSSEIIHQIIVPKFRAGDYSGGLADGVHAMMSACRGEFKGTGRTSADGGGNQGGLNYFSIGVFMFILFVAGIARRFRGNSVSQNPLRGSRNTNWPLSGGGSWGGGGGGGGGGGFSGGGGSFGGGGAGGSW